MVFVNEAIDSRALDSHGASLEKHLRTTRAKAKYPRRSSSQIYTGKPTTLFADGCFLQALCISCFLGSRTVIIILVADTSSNYYKRGIFSFLIHMIIIIGKSASVKARMILLQRSINQESKRERLALFLSISLISPSMITHIFARTM